MPDQDQWKLRGDVVPVHVEYGQSVDLYWRLKDGQVLVERRTCPPAATAAVRLEEQSGETNIVRTLEEGDKIIP